MISSLFDQSNSRRRCEDRAVQGGLGIAQERDAFIHDIEATRSDAWRCLIALRPQFAHRCDEGVMP
jgi:hypothetical protein